MITASCWLLASIAEERPVLLLADDLHWCDPSSLRWLTYLARRIDGLPVALLAASRRSGAGEPGAAGPLAVAGIRVRRLETLSPEWVGELIARSSQATPAPAFVRACHTATGGNPWLLQELLASVREAESCAADEHGAGRIDVLAGDRLRPTVLARLGRLEAPARQLACAVAVLGDGCELRLACALARIGSDTAIAALPALIGAGVLADTSVGGLRPSAPAELPSISTSPRPCAPPSTDGRRRCSQGPNAGAEAVSHHLLAAEPVGEEWALAALENRGGWHWPARGSPVGRRSTCGARAGASGPRARRSARSCCARSARRSLEARRPCGTGRAEEALELTASPAARAEIPVAASADPLLAPGRACRCPRSLLTAALSPTPRATRCRVRHPGSRGAFWR